MAAWRHHPAQSLEDVLADARLLVGRGRGRGRGGGRGARAGRSATMQMTWVTNGSARPRPKSRAPMGGPASWLNGDDAGDQPGVGDAQVGLGHDHREQGRGRGVREGLPHPEQEHRRQHDGDVDLVGDDRADQDGDDDDTAQVGDGHQAAAVDPVGDRPRRTGRRGGTGGTAGPRRARPGTGHASPRRRGADRPRPGGRRRCCSSSSRRAATGTGCRAGPAPRTRRRIGTQAVDARRAP